jgi:hypothetical protein
MRPVDYGSLGQYRILVFSVNQMNAGIAAGADIFQALWTVTPQIALIWGVHLDGTWVSTAFTPGLANFTLTIARSWTVAGGGASPAILTGNNQKLRTSMGSSLMGAILGANQTALTPGTRTLDNQPIGQIAFSVSSANNYSPVGPMSLYGASSLEAGGNNAPIVLAQNEGLVVRATVPATGVWGYGITLSWSEVSAY